MSIDPLNLIGAELFGILSVAFIFLAIHANRIQQQAKPLDQWKLAKWLYDYEAKVDRDGVQLKSWDEWEQKKRDAYYHLAGECIESINHIEVREGE